MPYGVGDYNQFSLKKQYPNNWSLGVLFTTGIKVFRGRVYHTRFLVCIFEPVFFNVKNLLRYWFIYRDNVLTHIRITRQQKNATLFFYSWKHIRLLLYRCMLILDWPQNPYNWDYYCFCLYQQLLEIIVVCIILTASVIRFPKSSQGRRKK